ncbi:MAG TPA: sulfotransferase, partial [Geminicoccaceae bacterium]|nr:sulfotransferase [Geminicoccaceae bacterium]
MSVDKILSSFRPGEIIDDLQIEELKRWRLLDFRPEPDDDHTSHAPIVVVCGCGRSGTTLARVMLDTHPELYAGPESLVFLPVPVDAGDLARKFDLGEREVQALHEGTPSRARFTERFKDLVLLTSGKRLWVDKTARNVHRLDHIWRHFSQARVIHVVREPRDVVASLKT